MTEAVEHPSHYADGWSNGAEVIDITEHLNFNRGNAVKYIARAGKKNPDTEIEDLRKAQWYLQRELYRLGADGPTDRMLDAKMASEGQPRVWEDFSQIPAGVGVRDKDGDSWHSDEDTYQAEASLPWLIERNRLWGPFTEILESE